MIISNFGVGFCTVYKFYKTTHPHSEKEENNIKEKASKAAVEYFKKEKNWDVTVTKVEFSTDISRSWINVYGYVSGDEEKRVSARVEYRNDYEIGSTSY